MPKFTKGPWLVADDNFVYALNDAGFNRFSCPVQRGHSDRDTRLPDDEVSANAHLISAAPDMYAALDAADTAFAVLQVQDLGSQARSCVREAWPLVQSALAKAVPDSSYAEAVGEAQQHEIARLDRMAAELAEALAAALEWIDAVPSDTVLPSMPGFDRDWVNGLLDVAAGGVE